MAPPETLKLIRQKAAPKMNCSVFGAQSTELDLQIEYGCPQYRSRGTQDSKKLGESAQ